MLIRLIKDWKEPDIFRQTPMGDGKWGDIQFTFDPIEEADGVVVFTRPPFNIDIKCPRGMKWLISLEPPTPFHRFHLKSYRYFDRVVSQHSRKSGNNHILTHGALPWHINKSFSELIKLPPARDMKLDKVSCIVSNLNWMKGHELRLKFVDFLNKSKFPIELYGRGSRPIEDKFDALYPFKYSIAFENSSYKNYWTEKIADCFLSWSIPIYYGCPNILDYFPEGSILLVDPKKPEQSLKKIEEAVQNNYWEKNLNAVAEARDLILNKYQFFPFITNLIGEKFSGHSNNRKTLVTIPYNPAPWEKEYKPSLYRKIEYRIRRLLDLKPF
jgi:hypothetical protein